MKYKVSINKTNKVVLIIGAIICLGISVGSLLSLIKYYYNIVPILICTIICLSLFLIFLNSTIKFVEFYKDYVIYQDLFKKRKYKLCDIYIKEINEDTFKSHDIDFQTYNFKIATFCDLNGKKLFKLDDSYINYDLFVKDIKQYKSNK